MVCYVDLFFAVHRNTTDDLVNFHEIVDYSNEVDKFAMKNSKAALKVY